MGIPNLPLIHKLGLSSKEAHALLSALNEINETEITERGLQKLATNSAGHVLAFEHGTELNAGNIGYIISPKKLTTHPAWKHALGSAAQPLERFIEGMEIDCLEAAAGALGLQYEVVSQGSGMAYIKILFTNT